MSDCHLCGMDAPAGYRLCRPCMSRDAVLEHGVELGGVGAWMPGSTPENAIVFGVDRSVALRPRDTRAVPRWRWWLGYRLYSVVYWLLGGHA